MALKKGNHALIRDLGYVMPEWFDSWNQNDASDAIQEAHDFLISNLDLNIESTYGNTIGFSNRIYKVTKQINLTPFIKLKSLGFAQIHSYIDGGVLFNFEHLNTTPTKNVYKQSYMYSPIINGIDGGFIIENKNANKNTTAVQFGRLTTTDSSRPMSRYALQDVAIQKFNVAIQYHSVNNYIFHSSRLKLEGNNTCVVFGKTGALYSDSGENFVFRDCVFASCQVGFEWKTENFDTLIDGCSCDYISDSLFLFSSGSYRTARLVNSYLEASNLIVRDTLSSQQNNTQVYIINTMDYEIGTRKNRADTGVRLFLDTYEHRNIDLSTHSLKSKMYFNSGVGEVRIVNNRKRVDNGAFIAYSKNSLVPNFDFSKQVVGDTDVQLVGYTVPTKSGCNLSVVGDDVDNTKKMLKINATTTNAFAKLRTTKIKTKNFSHDFRGNVVFSSDGSLKIAVRILAYDISDILIKSTDLILNTATLTPGVGEFILGKQYYKYLTDNTVDNVQFEVEFNTMSIGNHYIKEMHLHDYS